MNLIRAFRDIWRGLVVMLWELPLREITHRPRPDYARIAQLELELGWRESISPPRIPFTNVEYQMLRARFLTANEARQHLMVLPYDR
jgi:hypothetical protein